MIIDVREESRQIAFREGEFLVKVLETEGELRQAYHLRHRVFAEKLRWVRHPLVFARSAPLQEHLRTYRCRRSHRWPTDHSSYRPQSA